jgi:ribosomal protein S18 acetylase RimI-like enzyme
LQGTNVAIQLLDEFERKLSPNSTYGLSVKSSNERAINFYKKNGFSVEKEGNSIYLLRNLG